MGRKPKPSKLNSMRLLEREGVAYRLLAFDPGIHSASGVAQALGVDPRRVFKTLVALAANGRPLLAMLPAERELDTKALARAAGVKRVQMASHAEAERLTGLLTGGISALALAGGRFEVFLDQAALELGETDIVVSAGQRGLNLELRPDDLCRVTGAQLAPLTRQIGHRP